MRLSLVESSFQDEALPVRRQDPLYRPRSSIAGPRSSSQDSGEYSEQDPPLRRKQPQQQLQPGSASGVKPRHDESRFEPIPRARKRKPG